MRKLDCIKGCGENRTILDGEIKRRNKWLNSSDKKHQLRKQNSLINHPQSENFILNRTNFGKEKSQPNTSSHKYNMNKTKTLEMK